MTKFKTRDYVLALQHLFAMFGATVLVPLQTGLNPSVALVCAGAGTLLFHAVTKGMVPVFLGSSFAFLPAIAAAVSQHGVPYAQGGIIVAGCVYLVFSLIAYLIGANKIKKLFPPIVTGSVVVVIGINLAATAIKDAFNIYSNGSLKSAGGSTYISLNKESGIAILIALFTILIVVVGSIYAKGFLKLIPILIGIAAGYLLCVILNALDIFDMSFDAVKNAPWINIPFKKAKDGADFFSAPRFNLSVILSIAPIAIVTFMEHIGDITTNGAVVGKDFFKEPGLHRTLLGDGIATIFAGCLGGPANTTYSENTGVLATTKNYNPALLRLAAIFAIILGFIGKFGAILRTIPDPVKGGVEIILFGMIAAIGIRTLSEAKIDFTHSRNLIIVALILVLGLGINSIGGIAVKFSADLSINFSGLFVSVIVGIIANLILPEADSSTAKK